MTLQEWAAEFDFLEGTEKLEFLIDMAKTKTTLPSELRTPDRLVNGCTSQIWIEVGIVDNRVQVYYDSDALITKGITGVVADCFSDITVDEAKAIKKQDFEVLGIEQLLSAQRRNGLGSLIDTIQSKIHKL